MSPTFLVVLLSLLLGLQPLTTDLYLPALPAITDFFGADPGKVQLTLSALILSFGLSQLVWGPVSDRYGRKPVMLLGLMLYTLAALGSSLAASLEALILWRILQGAAMGAAIMCGRALVRDLFDDPVRGARVMSLGLSGLGILACLGTPLGGALMQWFGWRETLFFLALFGGAVLLLASLRMQETLAAPNHDALRPTRLFGIWKTILGHSTFWAFALLQVGSYAGLFVFLVSSSFVFIRVLDVSALGYGLLMFSMSFFYIVGTLICRRLLLHFSVTATVALGGLCALLGGGLLLLSVLLEWPGIWAVMLPVYLFVISHGINQPCSHSGVMQPFPHSAGAATALSSVVMVLVAFVVGLLLGEGLSEPLLPMAVGIGSSGVFVAAVAWLLVPMAARSSERAAHQTAVE
ncbi:multidrug effflux MFS transporter [Marinospirillum alkaliphilum]|uniref:Bcr/CflA family efflux transporter n=1 Tax=Marinospirillum alkaliphilum DSM 21637 TaxID=1122209 RepID=A0A1K1ZUA2_9GAMM|nr:multidrug effflux MFS transporter [Marinospirillum alkaliphilum]SFX77737.1 MFS transporter, DHA1 family, bicyclomycin/chloramphenicol resistance protein [Marinospirillum alkaliphilum DSM 21637]